MKRALLVAATCLAALPLLAQAPAPEAPAAATAAVATQGNGSKVWIGRYAEYEEFLRTAKIERVEKIPLGVTKPERGFFAPGGLAASAAIKHLPTGRRDGFWESYKSEIAAYQLDRLLGLDMVPPTVERRVGRRARRGRALGRGLQAHQGRRPVGVPEPGQMGEGGLPAAGLRQPDANIDDNAGNILVDAEWNMVLIDHSRAFAADKMPFEKEMTRVDRELFDRLKALDEAGLMKHVRPWVLADGSIRDILKRRDKIVARFETLARERGEAVVFPF